MSDVHNTLNEVLVNLFNDIMTIEEKAIITDEFKDISNNDMHIISAIGIESKKNMSTIAAELGVTVGTLTIAINNLVKKGYVIRQRGTKDKRVVYITLADKGLLAYAHHAKFHEDMITAITGEFKEDELELLVSILTRLVTFFRNR